MDNVLSRNRGIEFSGEVGGGGMVSGLAQNTALPHPEETFQTELKS